MYANLRQAATVGLVRLIREQVQAWGRVRAMVLTVARKLERAPWKLRLCLRDLLVLS